MLCYQGEDSFFYFVSLKKGLSPFLKFHLLEGVVNKVLQIAWLHMVFFKCDIVFFKFLFEDFVLKSHRASPLTKPFIAFGGWHVIKDVPGMSPSVWRAFSHRELFVESLTLVYGVYMVMSKKVSSVLDIWAINFIFGWCLFACPMKFFSLESGIRHYVAVVTNRG